MLAFLLTISDEAYHSKIIQIYSSYNKDILITVSNIGKVELTLPEVE